MMDRIYSKRYRQVQYMGNKQQNEIHFQKMQSRIDQRGGKEKKKTKNDSYQGTEN